LGWLVVASSFVAVFCSYGFLNSYGVYAELYKNNLYKDTPAAVIALIGTLQVAFLNATGPFASPLSSLVGGFKIVIAMGGVIMGLGMIIASFAKSIAMLIIFQGIVVGIGAGLCITLCVSVPAPWFTKRRGLAIGIVWSGSGLGGVAFAPMTRKLMSTVG
ncbi:MFS general substrate transporter, partial [Ramicandelaber brevisporus]